MKHVIMSGMITVVDRTSRINSAGFVTETCQATFYDDKDRARMRPLTLPIPCDIAQAGESFTLDTDG